MSNIIPEERLLLTIEGVTETYPDSAESANGTLNLYLVSIPMAPDGKKLDEGTEDIYLHATLPSGLSIPLSGETTITKPSDTSFTIIGNSLSDVTVTLEFFAPGSAAARNKELVDEDVDSLETIFTQFCLLAHKNESNSLVLVDYTDGHEIGSLHGMAITESSDLPHDKSPVEVVINQDNNQVLIQPITPPPAESPSAVVHYDKNDYILSTASNLSNGMVFVSNKLSSGMESAANWWVKNRPASEKPLVFQESTKTNVQRMSKVTGTGAYYSRKAVVAVSDAAASLGQRLTSSRKSKEANATTISDADADNGITKAPKGVLNRSLIAFSTVMDGLDVATQSLVKGASSSTSKVIGHSYGPEAESLAANFGRSVTNCTMVYIDARGIYRKTIVKGVGRGVVNGILGHDKVIVLKQAPSPHTGSDDAMKMSTTDRFVSMISNHLSKTPSSASPTLPPRPSNNLDNKIQYS